MSKGIRWSRSGFGKSTCIHYHVAKHSAALGTSGDSGCIEAGMKSDALERGSSIVVKVQILIHNHH